VYRFLLTPRWWAINVFVAAAIPFCLVLGFWQLGRFEDRVDGHRDHAQQTQAARNAEAVPLTTLLPVTTDTVGEVASVTGRYDAERQLLVPRRTMNDKHGFYVLTPLLPDGGGAAVPVIRGWLPGDPDPGRVPAAPEGTVSAVGILQSAESPRAVNAPTGLPAGQVGVISAASLINLLPYEVADAWLTVRDAEPPLVAVPAVAASGTSLDAKAFQNLGYTAQWFVFAAFVIFMWYRFFRRELETRRDAELGLLTPDPQPGDPQPNDPGRDGPRDGPADDAGRSRSPVPAA
jgi:cytochrome oxidase assembly protein ShyY1